VIAIGCGKAVVVLFFRKEVMNRKAFSRKEGRGRAGPLTGARQEYLTVEEGDGKQKT